MKPDLNRREFLRCAAASTAALTIVPRQVLGGPGTVAPSERIHLAYIGCGTQGLREMLPLLAQPEVQIVAVCDPNRDGADYVDWSKTGLRDEIRRALGNPAWRQSGPSIPGGRDVAKEIIETYYAKQRAAEHYQGCKTYIDFRELLANEKDVDAVKIMTPDHLHATIAIAAMKKGKNVLVHKPLANRLREARLVVETARQTQVATHFLPASDGQSIRQMVEWVKGGAIGTLREVHNWSNRPVWPQYLTLPTERPPVPRDFDWDLWLGPSLPRPYHPHYTHAVFRGWYEFGGGSLADMGHYSLWPVFQEFGLEAPIAVESTPSHVCTVREGVSTTIHNDYSFPIACTIRFRFAAKGDRPALDLFWYDGGIRPPTPEELDAHHQSLQAEGMMWVGDRGRILAGFHGENPRLIVGGKSETAPRSASESSTARRGRGLREASWIRAFKGGPPAYGNFLLAGPISEAFTLGAISLRLGGQRLLWDAQAASITNVPNSAKYLTREYRPGWELS